MIGAASKLLVIKRELAMRRSLYPKWVASGRMTQQEADHQIEVMEAIAKDYEDDIEFERNQGKLL